MTEYSYISVFTDFLMFVLSGLELLFRDIVLYTYTFPLLLMLLYINYWLTAITITTKLQEQW